MGGPGSGRKKGSGGKSTKKSSSMIGNLPKKEKLALLKQAGYKIPKKNPKTKKNNY